MDDLKLFQINGVSAGYELNPTELETRFMTFLKDIIKDSRLDFTRNSQNYISALCGRNDFVRFKLSDKTKWFTLFIVGPLRKEYMTSPLFEAQENKRLNQWKVKFDSFGEIEPYKEVILKVWKIVSEYEFPNQ